MQGNGQFANHLQGHKRTSGSDPRTGTFHQKKVTVDDTACSVKGVLLFVCFVAFPFTRQNNKYSLHPLSNHTWVNHKCN